MYKDGQIGIWKKSSLMEIALEYSTVCDFFFTFYTMQNLAVYDTKLLNTWGPMFHGIAFFFYFRNRPWFLEVLKFFKYILWSCFRICNVCCITRNFKESWAAASLLFLVKKCFHIVAIRQHRNCRLQHGPFV